MTSQKKYAISAGNPATLQAADEVLAAGGNAVDAAIAAYLASFVAEPCMASVGAGGFAMVHAQGHTQLIDFFCQTPRQKLPAKDLDFFPVTIDFGNATEDFHVGKGAAATPGAIAGIYKMHQLYGSMPISELAAFAINIAKTGVLIDGFQAYDISLLEDIFKLSEDGRSLLFDGVQKKVEGDKIFMPQFADFLETLVIEGPDLFYKGEVAKVISRDFAEQGGNLSRADFAHYEAVVREPISFRWQEQNVFTTSDPSAGGAIIAAFLKTFSEEQRKARHLSQEHFEHLSSVFRKVNKVKDDPIALAAYLQDQFDIKIPAKANTAHKWSGTSHFNIVDSSGMAVALTTSLGEGCGYFIPGTDMQMNNMLGEAALLPQGFHSWTPDTRLRSMMTPTMITDQNNKLKLITGSGGAGRIPFAIAQVIINHLLYGIPLAEAVGSPRIHMTDDSLNIEKGYDLPSEFEGKEWADQSLFFGGVHSISVDRGRYAAAGDLRRLGVSKVV